MDIKMQETRTLKELYEILWEDIKDRDYLESICYRISNLYICQNEITDKEFDLLNDHFLSQFDQHAEFMTIERNWSNRKNSYWWTFDEDSKPINRKAFIQKIISTLD